MCLPDQSGVTGGGLDPYNVHALFVNMDNMWTERFGYQALLVIFFYWSLKLKLIEYLYVVTYVVIYVVTYWSL